MRHILLVLLLLAGCGATAAAPESSTPTYPLVFRAPEDSVFVQVGTIASWVKLSDFSNPDTSWLGSGHDLTLTSSIDTLVLNHTESPVKFTIFGATDTIIEVVFFTTEFEAKQEQYLERIRQYPRFDATMATEFAGFPAFDTASERARNFREKFMLDLIADPRDDEMVRVMNLLHWVHASITYDGSKEAPDAPTLTEQVEIAISQGKTMHCGALAGTFAYACNSLGIPARQVACMTYDSADTECHSLVVVYLKSLGKWVWMDPTWEAFVKSEDGTLLGPAEVRERLVRGERIFVNESINVNGKSESAAWYLAYMSKNLFRFIAWGENGQEVHLNPTGFSETLGSRTGATVFYTDDPGLFWAAP